MVARGASMPNRPEKRPERGGSASSAAPTEPAATANSPAEAAAQHKPGQDRVDIAGVLSLNVPPEWQFYPLEDRVIGRHSSKVGVLQIKVLPPSAAPREASHEMLMSVARDMSGYELEGTGSDPAKERIGCCLAGGESFRSGNDFVRVWYHQRPEGIAVASFAFKGTRVGERTVSQLIRQCDKIVASMRLPESAAHA
jgi:hypothetical protein